MSETGTAKYTPTRIDWLAVFVNAVLPKPTLYKNGVEISLFPYAENDTIEIFVRYYDYIAKEILETIVNETKDVIMKIAESYNWDSWVKIDVEYIEVHKGDE